MFFSKITIYSEFLQFQTLLFLLAVNSRFILFMAYIGEQTTFLNTEILYISNTYNHPFTFSVEMHSTFEWGTNRSAQKAAPFKMKSDTSDLSFPFSIVPFQAKGKEENEDDGLKLMTDPQDPSFLLFDAKSLNRTKKIWVRLKRHHRRNRAKTILFFYCYDTNGRSSERRTSSLLECYPESCRTNPKGNAQL